MTYINPMVDEIDRARAWAADCGDSLSQVHERILFDARTKIAGFYPRAPEAMYTPELRNALRLARVLNLLADRTPSEVAS